MNRRYAAPTILAAALFLLLTGSAAALQLTEASTFEVDLAADGRISLENVNGNVTIMAWDNDQVSIEAVKKGRSQEALDATEIVIDDQTDRLHIETRYAKETNRRHDSASVDYTIHVPRQARLDEIELVNGSLTLEGIGGDVVASLVNGEVKARELSGDAEISTVNGRLDIALSELSADSRIDLSSVNGSVDLSLPGRVDAEVDASTVHGGIKNDFGLEVDRGEFVGRKLRGTLGGGGARLELSNVNGSISIRQAS